MLVLPTGLSRADDNKDENQMLESLVRFLPFFVTFWSSIFPGRVDLHLHRKVTFLSHMTLMSCLGRPAVALEDRIFHLSTS
jgi:hypothetical protein